MFAKKAAAANAAAGEAAAGTAAQGGAAGKTVVAKIAAPLAAVLALASCAANPGDAPTVAEEPKQEIPDTRTMEIIVGVDSVSSNMNPHLSGNLGLATSAVADLTLPSAFLDSPEGRVPNLELFSAVEPDNLDAPTAVRFVLAPEAQWSDGTPITHSDFRYLAHEIVDTPSAAQSALYSHITSIEPDGDAFIVHFDGPFTAYRSLFDHLLPSHIYGAEGRDFATMMENSVAASAGAYAVRSINSGRGTIELQRNDRYWGKSAAQADRLTLNSVPNVHTGAQMVRTGQLQMLATRPTQTTGLTLALLPDTQLRLVGRPVQLDVVLNTSRLRDVQSRRQLLSAIDPLNVSRVTTGTMEPAAAGWNVTPEPLPELPAAREPLVVGAEDTDAMVAARTVVDELNARGIPASVRSLPSGMPLQSLEGIDMVVTWQHSPETAADYIEQFGCSAPQETNLTGLCDEDINSRLEALLRGETSIEDEREALDQAIRLQAVVLPLFGDTSSIVTTTQLIGPEPQLSEWYVSPNSGVFASAADWRRKEEE